MQDQMSFSQFGNGRCGLERLGAFGALDIFLLSFRFLVGHYDEIAYASLSCTSKDFGRHLFENACFRIDQKGSCNTTYVILSVAI